MATVASGQASPGACFASGRTSPGAAIPGLSRSLGVTVGREIVTPRGKTPPSEGTFRISRGRPETSDGTLSKLEVTSLSAQLASLDRISHALPDSARGKRPIRLDVSKSPAKGENRVGLPLTASLSSFSTCEPATPNPSTDNSDAWEDLNETAGTITWNPSTPQKCNRQNDANDGTCASACVSPSSEQSGAQHKEARRLRHYESKFDELRIREWFDFMDEDKNGHVTKQEWIKMSSNPQFARIMLGETSNTSCLADERQARKNEEAKVLRLMLKAWRNIDVDGNGTLEWHEFLDFFRASGKLLEYHSRDNPKDRMADILGHLHDSTDQDLSELDEFESLKAQHLHGNRRRSLGAVEANRSLAEMEIMETAAASPEQSPVFMKKRQTLCRLATGASFGSEAFGA